MIDINITKATDHPDGTVTFEMEMDENTLIFLAKIGFMQLIETAAGRVLDGYPDTEGAEDPPTRGDGAEHLFGEIPGL